MIKTYCPICDRWYVEMLCPYHVPESKNTRARQVMIITLVIAGFIMMIIKIYKGWPWPF